MVGHIYTAKERASDMKMAADVERKRCLKIIAIQQRQYEGGSSASVALGALAIAIRTTANG